MRSGGTNLRKGPGQEESVVGTRSPSVWRGQSVHRVGCGMEPGLHTKGRGSAGGLEAVE